MNSLRCAGFEFLKRVAREQFRSDGSPYACASAASFEVVAERAVFVPSYDMHRKLALIVVDITNYFLSDEPLLSHVAKGYGCEKLLTSRAFFQSGSPRPRTTFNAERGLQDSTLL